MLSLLNSLCKRFYSEQGNLGGKYYQLKERFARRDETRTDTV